MTTTRHTQYNDLTDYTDNDDVFHDVSLHDVSLHDEFLEEESNNKSDDKCLSNSSFFSKLSAKKVDEAAKLMANAELKFNTDSTDDDEKNQATTKSRRYCLIV